jgi:hypothetical protein
MIPMGGWWTRRHIPWHDECIYDAEIDELNKVRRLALRRGWTVAPESYRVACCDHTPSDTEEKQ